MELTRRALFSSLAAGAALAPALAIASTTKPATITALDSKSFADNGGAIGDAIQKQMRGARPGDIPMPHPTPEQRRTPRFEEGPDFIGLRAPAARDYDKEFATLDPSEKELDQHQFEGAFFLNLWQDAIKLNYLCSTVLGQAEERVRLDRYLLPGDTVTTPRGVRVTLEHHLTVSIPLWDPRRLYADPARRSMHTAPAIEALALRFGFAAWKSRAIAIAQMPLPLRGCGAMGARSYFNHGPLCLRAILSYEPNSLRHLLQYDILFGVA